jgi:hypothetical protein
VHKNGRFSLEDLYALSEWKALAPDVPEGDCFKDFGSFKLCGKGRYPSTFLTAGQVVKGKRLD